MSGTVRTSAEIEELRRKLAEAEETIDAIRTGAVDAFVVQESGVERVYALQSADRPYRVLVETMRQGALVLASDATILFANRRIADMLGVAHEKLVGAALGERVAKADRGRFDALIRKGRQEGSAREEITMIRSSAQELSVHVTIEKLPVGDSAAFCVIVTDLTHEKEQKTIEQDRTLLQHSEVVLREADRRKDEFLAILAHDTPRRRSARPRPHQSQSADGAPRPGRSRRSDPCRAGDGGPFARGTGP